MKSRIKYLIAMAAVLAFSGHVYAADAIVDKDENRKINTQQFQQKFDWWPTDALPKPVRDEKKGGYWWWPTTPGKVSPGGMWGNRGYCYVRKVIFDYKEEELPAPKPQEMRPSLIIRKIIKNVKVYFDYDKADLRDDAASILSDAVKTLKKNPETSILITGNCDIRGTESYNDKLGKRRGETVKQYMLDNGIPQERIRIISRGKLDAIAPVTDLVGMQKDRNAQFMVAQVEEVMMPYQGEAQPATAEGTVAAPVPAPVIEEGAKKIDEGKYLVEKEENVESKIKVSTKEYVTKPGDTLWDIAKKELGNGNRWKNIYELNKDKISNPNKLKAKTTIVIPIE